MTDRYPEDCIVCRAQTLNCTPAQIELIKEAMASEIAAGWTKRGLIPRIPSNHNMTRMMRLAHVGWSAMFGTGIPESPEVQQHRHQHGDL